MVKKCLNILGPLALLIPGINSRSLTTSSVARSLTFAFRHRNYRKSYYDDYSRDKEYYAKDRHRDSYGSGYGYRSRSRSYSPREWILYCNNNIIMNLFFSFLM